MVDLVKLIRANKDKNYDKWLRPEDWEIIESNVLPSQWYPFESYERIGLAAFKEIGGSDVENSRGFGKITLNNLLKVYKTLLIERDPAESIDKFIALRGAFFKDAPFTTTVTERGEDFMKLTISTAPELAGKEIADSFAYQFAGSLEELVERTGVKNVNVVIERREDSYEYRIGWE
jgi:hypothetical protein